MTIAELFNELEYKARDTYIVTLKYKYEFEENYTIENLILEYDSKDDSYVWLDDWNEGQTDIEVLGYMPLSDVDTTKPLTSEDCISRQAIIDAFWKLDIELRPSAIDTIINMIKSMSPIVPPQNIGNWLAKSFHEVYCANCGFEFDIMKNEFVDKMNYCPNCGIKMGTKNLQED